MRRNTFATLCLLAILFCVCFAYSAANDRNYASSSSATELDFDPLEDLDAENAATDSFTGQMGSYFGPNEENDEEEEDQEDVESNDNVLNSEENEQDAMLEDEPQTQQAQTAATTTSTEVSTTEDEQLLEAPTPAAPWYTYI